MITVINFKLRSLLSLVLGLAVLGTAAADKPSLLRMFGRAPSVEADSSKSYQLTEEDGPWMILASNFVGEGSKVRAERLAFEIRRELGLPAFIYQERFDFTGNINADPRSAIRVRYANRYQYDAYAVLVGEYDSTEHPNIESDLTRVRKASLPVFQDPGEIEAETKGSNPVTTVKSFASRLLNAGTAKPSGPMSQAFVTRNPMLPEEYFAAPEVDSFVSQLNEGQDFSLLKCKGKYTVIVKTFHGAEVIVDGKNDKKFEPSGERLDKFAANAKKMTLKLRDQGVEAYQFHDRYKSLVTVGSFDTLGRELPDGRFEYASDIRAVMRKFSAFNVSPELKRQVPAGVRGFAGNNVAMIPFDVKPTPIAVPRSSKRSLYGSALGMR